MRILIISKSEDSLVMAAQLLKIGHSVALAPNELQAVRWLADVARDLVLLTPDDKHTIEIDKTAAALKEGALVDPGMQKPYVFLVCGTKEEFDRANGDKSGMPAVDAILQVFSAGQCEHVYECLRSGGSIPLGYEYTK